MSASLRFFLFAALLGTLLLGVTIHLVLWSRSSPRHIVLTDRIESDWGLYHTLEKRADSTELLSNKTYLMVVGIATCGKSPKYRRIRDVTRQTWMTWNRSDVLVLFFDARLSSMPFERAQEYLKEYREFGDLAFVPGDDNMANPRLGSTNKQLGWWEYVYRHYSFQFAVKLDDDVYVHLPRLATYARDHLPKRECFAGREQQGTYAPLRSSFPRARPRPEIVCGFTKAVVGQVQILSNDLVRWLGMDAHFPRWIRTPADMVEDWALGCMMGLYKNASGQPLTVTYMGQNLLAGICAWLGGKLNGLTSVLSFHMAGNFKHQTKDTSAAYFYFFHELFVQHAKTKRWNETLLTQFTSRPEFVSAVASCDNKFDCSTDDCSASQLRVQRFQDQILQLNEAPTP